MKYNSILFLLVFFGTIISCSNRKNPIESLDSKLDTVLLNKKMHEKEKLFLNFWVGMTKPEFDYVISSKNQLLVFNDVDTAKIEPIFIEDTLYSIKISFFKNREQETYYAQYLTLQDIGMERRLKMILETYMKKYGEPLRTQFYKSNKYLWKDSSKAIEINEEYENIYNAEKDERYYEYVPKPGKIMGTLIDKIEIRYLLYTSYLKEKVEKDGKESNRKKEIGKKMKTS